MLDLRNMSDEEFEIIVTPSMPQAATRITIDVAGTVQLSSKVAEKFAGLSVQFRFNRNLTAIQITKLATEEEPKVVFPKNGRRTVVELAEILKENKIPFPVVYQGYFVQDSQKWRGERQQNPMSKSSGSTRSTGKK